MVRADDRLSIDTAALDTGAFIDAGGYRSRYHEAGSGEPLLFIYGSRPGDGVGQLAFRARRFAERYRVLAPDVLGFGYSDRPPGITSGKNVWVDHVIAFLEAKHVTRAHIVDAVWGYEPSRERMREDAAGFFGNRTAACSPRHAKPGSTILRRRSMKSKRLRRRRC